MIRHPLSGRKLLSSLPHGLRAWLAILALLAGFAILPCGQRQAAFAVEPVSQEATPDSDPGINDSDPTGHRTQQFAVLGADRWHDAGYRGRGVKIALLDSGFRGYREQLGKALPAKVQTRSFRRDGDLESKDSQHGILCAETLHALAPDAELLFANWEANRPDQFLQAVEWAKQQGARIISCSVIMPSWSDGEGGGPVHESLTRLVGNGARPDDLLIFACAGNTARRHWSGPFHPNLNGLHEWKTGSIANAIRPWGRDRVSVEVCWQPGCTYQVEVVDTTTKTEVGRSSGNPRDNRGCAVVRFQPQAGHNYQTRLRLLQGRGTSFHLVVLGGDLETATARGSIPFPADGPEVLAVGAVNGEDKRFSYSSCGPNSCVPKPDFMAPVPFPSLWRPRAFAGTSAAAPQAAGLAALCWSSHPEWTAAQVRDILRKSSHDLGPVGHDNETGYGRIGLPDPPPRPRLKRAG